MTSLKRVPVSSFKTAVAIYTGFLVAIFLAGAAFALSGCVGGLSASPSVSAQRTVYSAENDFTIALKVAIAYEQLPACSAAQKFPCSEPSTVTKITAAAKAARASLATAEAAVRSHSNAQAMTTAALQAESDVNAFAALAGGLSK